MSKCSLIAMLLAVSGCVKELHADQSGCEDVPTAVTAASLLQVKHASHHTWPSIPEIFKAFQITGESEPTLNSTVCSQMWDGKAVFGADDGHQCDMVPLAEHWTLGGGTPPQMCIRPYPDSVSDVLREQKRWPDCAGLSFLWRELADASVEADGSTFAPCGGDGVKKIFVDVGANVGACTMQMLVRPDVAKVVSFEPNPKNLFYLTSSILKDPSYNTRLALFPAALGESDGTHQMFMTPGNAGNTVLNTSVAANPILDVQPINASVITLDEVFLEAGKRPPYIHLMKMDAQGFEVNILRGGRQLLASGAINAIHFELAPAFLFGQGNSPAELLTILETGGYDIHPDIEFEDSTVKADLPAPLSHDDLVRIACTENDEPPRNFFAIYSSTKAGNAHQAIRCA